MIVKNYFVTHCSFPNLFLNKSQLSQSTQFQALLKAPKKLLSNGWIACVRCEGSFSKISLFLTNNLISISLSKLNTHSTANFTLSMFTCDVCPSIIKIMGPSYPSGL